MAARARRTGSAWHGDLGSASEEEQEEEHVGPTLGAHRPRGNLATEWIRRSAAPVARRRSPHTAGWRVCRWTPPACAVPGWRPECPQPPPSTSTVSDSHRDRSARMGGRAREPGAAPDEEPSRCSSSRSAWVPLSQAELECVPVGRLGVVSGGRGRPTGRRTHPPRVCAVVRRPQVASPLVSSVCGLRA